MGNEVVAIAVCLLGSAFFSASETALTSLPITRLESLRERTRGLTRRGLDRWARAPQELLITILIGNNLVNVLASALATDIARRLTGNGGLALAVGVMTLFILIFGEITPKSVAQIHAEGLSHAVAGPLYLLDRLLIPVTRSLSILTRILTRGGRAARPVTEQDLLFLLRLADRHDQLGSETRHMIESVLRFTKAVAREVMVPRPMVCTVDCNWSRSRVLETVTSTGFSRFPVVNGSPDAIVGILHAKRLLTLGTGESWSKAVAEPFFVPETKPLAELLQDFRRSHQHMALVLDEFGGFSGVVSLEDAVEIVVGEIEDEFDMNRGEAIDAGDEEWTVPGHLSLRRLERLMLRPLEPPEDVESVGGLVAHLRRHGESEPYRWQGLELRVLEETDGRPARVTVRAVPEDH
ncbi:MAG: HlyC/CorC family transporter [Acidobacteria bacterium]|nr:HlyC/CorC family transporter [Acidobacteriota bacterium]